MFYIENGLLNSRLKTRRQNRAAVTRKTSAQRATQTPTTKMARPEFVASTVPSLSLSLSFGQLSRLVFGGSKLVHDVTDSTRAASLCPKGAEQSEKREKDRESGPADQWQLAIYFSPLQPPESRCQRANVINLYNLTCALPPFRSLCLFFSFPPLSRRLTALIIVIVGSPAFRSSLLAHSIVINNDVSLYRWLRLLIYFPLKKQASLNPFRDLWCTGKNIVPLIE